jgi:PAS domain S-box-containing protein
LNLLERLLNTSAGIESVVIDGDGAILAANPAFARHAGLNADDLRGRPLTGFLAVHEASRLSAWLTGGTEPPLEGAPVSFVTAAGDPYTLRCHIERLGSGVRLVGEPDQEADASASYDLMRLNNELATLARENTRRRRELERAQLELTATLDELKNSYWHLQKIQEVMPVCMKCGRVKAGESRWDTVVEYLRSNEIFLSHGYCPTCAESVMREFGLDPEE